MTNFFHYILLIDGSFQDIARFVSDLAKPLLLPAFILSLYFEYITEMNFSRVVKSALIALLLINFYRGFHVSVVSHGFQYAEKILEKRGRNNQLIKVWKKALSKKNVKKIGFYDLVKGVFQVGDGDIMIKMLWFFIVCALMLLKFIYSFTYHFSYMFISITGIISLFGFMQDSWISSIKDTFWCFLFPIMLALLFCVFNEYASIEVQNGKVVYGLESYLNLFILILVIFMLPWLVSSKLNGRGFNQFSSMLSKNVGQALTFGELGRTALDSVDHSKKYAWNIFKGGGRGAARYFAKPLTGSIEAKSDSIQKKYKIGEKYSSPSFSGALKNSVSQSLSRGNSYINTVTSANTWKSALSHYQKQHSTRPQISYQERMALRAGSLSRKFSGNAIYHNNQFSKAINENKKQSYKRSNNTHHHHNSYSDDQYHPTFTDNSRKNRRNISRENIFKKERDDK